MSNLPKFATIQMASGPFVKANLIEAERLIQEAVKAKASMVVLPENFALMGHSEQDKVEQREQDGHGPIQDFLALQAEKHSIWLVGGTIPLEADASDKIRASCLVYDCTGHRAARYDKMHLFDVELMDGQEKYTESETIEAGAKSVVVETPCGRLGIAVCYDLRFPELFRNMLDQDMEILAVPSAFTAITGRAHWETLVRARAIENLCYVAAAAQGGYHINGRETHGDSMLVDPWGTILDHRPQGPGIAIAEFDRARLQNIRQTFPALQHRRLHCS